MSAGEIEPVTAVEADAVEADALDVGIASTEVEDEPTPLDAESE